MLETKTCSKCKRELPADKYHFYANSNSADGLLAMCRECKGYKFGKPKPIVHDGCKICSKCNREFPATVEYFFRCNRLKDDLQSSCKECNGYGFGLIKQPRKAQDGFKVCKACGEELPATTEYFHSEKNGKYGVHSTCKKCKNKQLAERRIANPEIYKKSLEANRKYWHKNKTRLKDQSKKWRDKNKDWVTEYRKKYYITHKEELNARAREYVNNHKEQHQEWQRRCREKNREKYRESNRSYYYERGGKEKQQQYNQENREKYRIIRRRRKQRVKELPATLTVEQWLNAVNAFENKCAYCSVEPEQLQQEHFIPVADGGYYTAGNIIPVCPQCNGSKNNRDFFDWYPRQPFYSKERERKILNYLGYKKGKQQLSMF